MVDQDISRKLAVIVHADVVGSTALVQRDETLAHQRINDTFQRFASIIQQYNGTVHEIRGDALVAEFARASDAVCAALGFQQSNTEHNAQLSDDIVPMVRIGIALGEEVFAHDTVTGAGVVLAQRVEQLAEPGGVCVTGAIHEAIPQRMPFDQESLGEQQVKGFDEPVRAYRVALKPGAAVPEAETSKQPEPPSQSRRLIVAFTAVALVIAGGVVFWLNPWAPTIEPASVERMAFPLPDRPSIAVLPFDNLSGDPEQEILSDGLTNDIITDLSKFKDLFVIASNSTFSYKGKAVKVQQVAEELGVRYVLEGSVQTTADKIRINAQLIDATTGRHLWAERYDRDVGDMFTIQNEIIETIVATLAFRVETVERERALRKDTESLDAYDNYLRARNIGRGTKEANAKAVELYEKAIELDPRYAKAMSRLAFAHAIGYQFRWSEDPDASLELALELAKKAAVLAPDDYLSHWALGYLYLLQRDFDLSETAYERARSHNANDVEFLANMSTTLLYLGRPREAIEGIRKAMRLNPIQSEEILAELGWAYYEAGQYEEAVRTFRSMNNPATWVHRNLAAAYVRLGRLEEARGEIAQMLEKEPDYSLERTKVWPYKDPARLDRYIEDLRKAGVPERPPLLLPDKPSIAVLPFTNMSDDPKQEYFVDGMTEDLITDLSKVAGLFVIARNSTFAYKGKSPDVRQVSRELGVKYVLEGSVRRAGEQVRINAQLIDATTGGHVWAERYDGNLKDVFGLQDEVTRHIVTVLAVQLTTGDKERASRKDTGNARAYDAFLQGWQHYLRQRPDDFRKAITHFERAVELDPQYTRAYAALAATYWEAWKRFWHKRLGLPYGSHEPRFRAEQFLAKAMQNPTPLAHQVASAMLLHMQQHEDAIAEAQRAIALDPNDADSYVALAGALTLAGKATEALGWVERAMRLNPHYPPYYLYQLGLAQFGMKQFEKAARTLETATTLNPDDRWSYRLLLATYGLLDRTEDATSAFETIKQRDKRGWLNTMDPLTINTSAFWLPFKEPADAQRLAQGLRKAGIPD